MPKKILEIYLPFHQGSESNKHPQTFIRIRHEKGAQTQTFGSGSKSSVRPSKPRWRNIWAGYPRESCWDTPRLLEKFLNKRCLQFLAPIVIVSVHGTFLLRHVPEALTCLQGQSPFSWINGLGVRVSLTIRVWSQVPFAPLVTLNSPTAIPAGPSPQALTPPPNLGKGFGHVLFETKACCHEHFRVLFCKSPSKHKKKTSRNIQRREETTKKIKTIK